MWTFGAMTRNLQTKSLSVFVTSYGINKLKYEIAWKKAKFFAIVWLKTTTRNQQNNVCK